MFKSDKDDKPNDSDSNNSTSPDVGNSSVNKPQDESVMSDKDYKNVSTSTDDSKDSNDEPLSNEDSEDSDGSDDSDATVRPEDLDKFFKNPNKKGLNVKFNDLREIQEIPNENKGRKFNKKYDTKFIQFIDDGFIDEDDEEERK